MVINRVLCENSRYSEQETFLVKTAVRQNCGDRSRRFNMYSFLFSAFAGRTHIGSDSENIFGFKADCLRIGNRLSFESDSESSRQEAPSFFGKEIS